jgi:hypothetical protein
MRFDLAAILIAAIIGGVIWIERDQSVVIDAPAVDVAPVAAACPDNDAVPYTASCIAYLKGATDVAIGGSTTSDALSVSAPH